MTGLIVWLTPRSHVYVSRLLEMAQWLIVSIVVVAFASGFFAFSAFFVMFASRVLPSKPIGVWSRIWLREMMAVLTTSRILLQSSWPLLLRIRKELIICWLIA